MDPLGPELGHFADLLAEKSRTGDPFAADLARLGGSSISSVSFGGIFLAVIDCQSDTRGAVVTLVPGLEPKDILTMSEVLRTHLRTRGTRVPAVEPILYDGVIVGGERISSSSTFVATNNRQLLERVLAATRCSSEAGEAPDRLTWPKMNIVVPKARRKEAPLRTAATKARAMTPESLARMVIGPLLDVHSDTYRECFVPSPPTVEAGSSASDSPGTGIRALAQNFRREVFIGRRVPARVPRMGTAQGAPPGEVCLQVLSKKEQLPQGSILNRSVLRLAAVALGRSWNGMIRVGDAHREWLSLEVCEDCGNGVKPVINCPRCNSQRRRFEEPGEYFAFSCDLVGPPSGYRGPLVPWDGRPAEAPDWALVASRVISIAKNRAWPTGRIGLPRPYGGFAEMYAAWASADAQRATAAIEASILAKKYLSVWADKAEKKKRGKQSGRAGGYPREARR